MTTFKVEKNVKKARLASGLRKDGSCIDNSQNAPM